MSTALPLSQGRYRLRDGVIICLRAAPGAAILYAAFDLVAGAAAPLRALAVARFIDAAIGAATGSSPPRAVAGPLSLVVALTAYEWLKRAMHNFADLKLVLALRERFRTALLAKQTRLAYRHFEEPASCDLMHRIVANPEGGALKATYAHLVELAAFAIKVSGLLLILTSAVWWAGLALLAVSGLTLGAGIRGGKVQYEAEREAAKYERRTDYLSGVLTGREAAAERSLFGFTPWLNRLWRGAWQRALAIRFKGRLRWYIRSYLGSGIAALSWIAVMVVLLPPLARGQVSVGLYIALTQALTDLDIVWGFMGSVNGISQDAEYFRDLTAFFALEERSEGSAAPSSTSTDRPSVRTRGEIELRDVRFRYPGAVAEVFSGLSCRLLPGRHYGIVGANGAGKTTLTRLLTGLYPVQGGEILLDGRRIEDYPSEELRARYSIVYQDFARYQLTLRENIALGRDGKAGWPSPFWEDLVDRVGLSHAIRRLSRGLDTPLGRLREDGVDLSDGEWQRVAMARALAVPASVRIFDEPTASLDPLEESMFYELFDRITDRQTTLFISHRLGATRLADEILVLDAGRIAESGTHDELMRRGGLYRRMFDSQRSWYER